VENASAMSGALSMDVVPSPVGPLTLVASDAGLRQIRWDGEGAQDGLGPPNAVLADARRQLEEYFAGTRRGFELPLDLAGTAFQLEAWRALELVRSGRPCRRDAAALLAAGQLGADCSASGDPGTASAGAALAGRALGRVASTDPTSTRAKPAPIDAVKRSPRTATPRTAATAGLT
jgi:hypothetical protein